MQDDDKLVADVFSRLMSETAENWVTLATSGCGRPASLA